MKHVETELGRAAYMNNFPSRELTSSKIHFQPVNEYTKFEIFGHIIASVFNPYDLEAPKFFKPVSNNYTYNENYQMFISYYENKAAETLTLVKQDEFGGIYDVVTKPEFQKKGIGTESILYAIKIFKRLNCKIVGMQASAEGKSIYDKIGFKTFDAFEVYSCPKD